MILSHFFYFSSIEGSRERESDRWRERKREKEREVERKRMHNPLVSSMLESSLQWFLGVEEGGGSKGWIIVIRDDMHIY